MNIEVNKKVALVREGNQSPQEVALIKEGDQSP